jgi:hypothetical protein
MRLLRRSLLPTVLALGLFAACAPLGGPSGPSAGAGGAVVVWGDSLIEEARKYLDKDHEVRAYGGLALCDWLADIEKIASSDPPATAVLQFAGNSRPCIGTRPLLDAYAEDAATAVRVLTAAGSRVVIVGIPPWRPDLGHDTAALNDVYRQAAQANPRATYSNRTVDALVENGLWTVSLPCLGHETALHGCVAGRTRVRGLDGAHFCPVGDPPSFPCPVYSSGAWRFANAINASV